LLSVTLSHWLIGRLLAGVTLHRVGAIAAGESKSIWGVGCIAQCKWDRLTSGVGGRPACGEGHGLQSCACCQCSAILACNCSKCMLRHSTKCLFL